MTQNTTAIKLTKPEMQQVVAEINEVMSCLKAAIKHKKIHWSPEYTLKVAVNALRHREQFLALCRNKMQYDKALNVAERNALEVFI